MGWRCRSLPRSPWILLTPSRESVGVLRIASAPRPRSPAAPSRETTDRVRKPPPPVTPAVRVSFAATSDSRDTRSGKARPERDCRVGLGTLRGSQKTMRRAQLFHATSAGARTRCAPQVSRTISWPITRSLVSSLPSSCAAVGVLACRATRRSGDAGRRARGGRCGAVRLHLVSAGE